MKKLSRTIKKFIVFGAPLIEQDTIDEVVATLKSGWIGTGPRASKFETLVRDYVGAKYAVAVNSCTAALHLSLVAKGVGPGDEVITTPLTFASTANVIIHVGAKPVFVDVNKKTGNIDPELIEKKINKKTRVIIPVHLAGRPCEMDSILRVAKKHNLAVVEDAAHALGAEYDGKKIGTISELTCFSFYVTKNVTTSEGGLITTDDESLAKKVRIYSLHGLSHDAWKRYSESGYKHYDLVYPGYKYNMTDIQAAIGIHQIDKIDRWAKKREKIWDYYNQEFRNLPITLPAEPEINTIHARHLYTLLIDRNKSGMTRDHFMSKLFSYGVGAGVHFVPVHLHKYYQETFNFKKGDFPNAEFIGERIVSLPFSAKLNDNEIEHVAKSIKKIFKT